MYLQAETNQLSRSAPLGLALAAGLVFAAVYADVVVELVRQWSMNPLYSYGFAVPVISGYLVATRWRQFSESIGAPDYLLGSLTIACAGLMFVVGDVGTILRSRELSLIVLVAGVVLAVAGRTALRQIWFAVAYLLLMVPIWTDFLARLQVPSQLLSGRIAVELFHAIGIPALREGTRIQLPQITLEILRECSGVNQLVAIFAIAVPAAYLWLGSAVRRVIFVATSLLIAYLSNGARIALIGVLAEHGFDTTTPAIHLAEGLAVAMLGYGLIALVLWAIRDRTADSDGRGPSAVGFDAEVGRARRTSVDVALVAVILICGTVGRLLPHRSVALRTALDALPRELGDWTRDGGWASDDDAGSYSADDEIRLTYRRASGERIRLYIGYLRFQHSKKNVTNILPLPRGNESVARIDLAPHLQQVNQIEQQTSAATTGILYWYELAGVAVTRRLDAKLQVLRNALGHGSTNGAVIMVAWDVPNGVSFQTSRDRALDFVRSLATVLPNFLPSRT